MQPVAAPAVAHTSAAVSSSPITTGSIQTPQSARQRCEQLRQDGDVWQRTRKLAVLNRGEAGGRMADLHTPWTKENVTFYLATCNSRKAKSPATTENGISSSRAGAASVASVRE